MPVFLLFSLNMQDLSMILKISHIKGSQAFYQMKLATEEIVPVFEIGAKFNWFVFQANNKEFVCYRRSFGVFHHPGRSKEFGV